MGRNWPGHNGILYDAASRRSAGVAPVWFVAIDTNVYVRHTGGVGTKVGHVEHRPRANPYLGRAGQGGQSSAR